MKIKMPFCANMNTGVPWDSGLPFLRALGPAHNRLKTTAGCFVPFEFCTDKNRSDIKCDSASLKGGGTSGRRQIRCVCMFPDFLFCLLLFQLTPPVTSDQWIWERSQSSHLKLWDDVSQSTNTREWVSVFSVFCTSSLEDVSQSQLSGSTETQFEITGCLKWYQACYAVTHTDNKKKQFYFSIPVQTPPHLTGGFAPPKRKTSIECEFSDLRGDRGPGSPAGS